MNDRLHYLEIMIAMTLIALGLTVMTLPWLGPRALLLGLGAVAAIVLGLAIPARGGRGISSGQIP